MEFNLEYYRTFYHVARLSSVTQAARLLCVTQPAVTHSIRELESALGCQLFVRLPKGMELTEEGQRLYGYVSQALELLERGEEQVASHRKETVVIGATETALYSGLLAGLKEFRDRREDIAFHITGSSTPELVEAVRAGRVDFGVMVTPLPPVQELAVRDLGRFQDIFAAGHSFDRLRDKVLSAKELCDLPLATVETGTAARKHIDLWFSQQGAELRPDFSVRTSSLILPFVKLGLAIGYVPKVFAQEAMDAGEIFPLQTEIPLPQRKIVLLTHPGRPCSSLISALIHYLSGRLGELAI